MRISVISVVCFLLLVSCNAQPEHSNIWMKGPGQSFGELYNHKSVDNVSLIVFSYAELSKTSAGTFPGSGEPADQLARIYEVMGLDALINSNRTVGNAFVEWGEAFVGDNHNYFAARMQAEGDGGKVFIMVTMPDDSFR